MQQTPVSEDLYARTAAFAEAQPNAEDRAALGGNIGKTAMKLLSGESIEVNHEHFDGVVETHTYGRKEYDAFLEEANEETRADIQYLIEKRAAFSDFEQGIAGGLGAFLGRGGNGFVYMMQHNGRPLAVKTGGVGYANVRSFRRAEGISHVPHLHAIDLEKSTLVMDCMPGRAIEDVDWRTRKRLSEYHLKQLIETVSELHDAGIAVDPKPNNFLYDAEAGFSVVDYQSQSHWNQAPRTKAQQVMSTLSALVARPFAKLPRYGSAGYEERFQKQRTQDVGLLNRVLDVLEQDYPEIIHEAAVEQAKINADKRVLSSRGMLYGTDGLPDGPLFEAFAQRIKRLGLAGKRVHPE